MQIGVQQFFKPNFFVIPSEVDESRDGTRGNATGSFDFASLRSG